MLAHCRVGLTTQQVVKMLQGATNHNDVRLFDVTAGDIVVIATQLCDNDLRSIKSESKRGYDSRDLGRPERMMCAAGHHLDSVPFRCIMSSHVVSCNNVLYV